MNLAQQKAWKGRAMEGRVACWYSRTRRKDITEFRREAARVAECLKRHASVLEVAPGPGFFAIELAKLGEFKITGLHISQSLVAIAKENAATAGINIAFRLGNASAMPFEEGSFDFVYCSAAFKNFSEPIKALNEMYRVLRPGCEAVISDLHKHASLDEIDQFVKQSGRSAIDAWITRWTFRHVLLKRAYSDQEFFEMARQSKFKECQITKMSDGGLRVKLRQNISRLWMIVPSENEHLAWSGSRWVPIDRHGISTSEVKAGNFVSASDAAAYAHSVGFEVERESNDFFC